MTPAQHSNDSFFEEKKYEIEPEKIIIRTENNFNHDLASQLHTNICINNSIIYRKNEFCFDNDYMHGWEIRLK